MKILYFNRLHIAHMKFTAIVTTNIRDFTTYKQMHRINFTLSTLSNTNHCFIHSIVAATANSLIDLCTNLLQSNIIFFRTQSHYQNEIKSDNMLAAACNMQQQFTLARNTTEFVLMDDIFPP